MYDVDTIVSTPEMTGPLADAVSSGAPPPFLRSVKIKLTARCNLTCIMCRYGKGWRPPELDGQRWMTLLPQMAAQGCRKVHFSGGEVLVRRDFELIAARAAEVGIKVTMTSNLTLLTKDRAKALMRTKISSISTSLDGATARMHESVRGIPGSFKRTLKAMGRIGREKERRGRRTRLRVNFVMMRRNVAHYPELIRIAAEHGATDVVPMPVDTKRDDLRLTKQLIRRYNEDIAPEVAQMRERYGMSMDTRLIYPFGRRSGAVKASVQGQYAADFYRDHACYAPYMHMFVAWDGKVYLCCMTNGRIEPLGDLSVQSVEEVFHGEAFANIRSQMLESRLPSCHACDMYLEENEALSRVLPGPSSVSSNRRLPVV
ncbi:MAG: radical SAM/SPASM domain-containing protein [Nannocystaceae bacterium]|nr:radical SAM protein [bacterium]